MRNLMKSLSPSQPEQLLIDTIRQNVKVLQMLRRHEEDIQRVNFIEDEIHRCEEVLLKFEGRKLAELILSDYADIPINRQ